MDKISQILIINKYMSSKNKCSRVYHETHLIMLRVDIIKPKLVLSN